MMNKAGDFAPWNPPHDRGGAAHPLVELALARR
jgi:hypothetical protein